jgi:hypothetical protein
MKTNWKSWASVAITAFVGGAIAHVAVPHDGVGARQILIGALLAGASAVLHLFQQPKVTAKAVE